MTVSQPRRPCAQPGCRELVARGRCARHARAQDERRGSARARGYTWQWEKWRRWFFGALMAFAVEGIGPGAICGARWPGLPSTGDSACLADGRETVRDLVIDHTPPLTDAERHDARAVCDRQRVQVLCAECHRKKTMRETRGVARA